MFYHGRLLRYSLPAKLLHAGRGYTMKLGLFLTVSPVSYE